MYIIYGQERDKTLQLDVCERRVAKYRDVHYLIDSVSFVPRDKACVSIHVLTSRTKIEQKAGYYFANDRLAYYYYNCRVTSPIAVSMLVSLVEGGNETNNIDRGYFIKASRG